MPNANDLRRGMAIKYNGNPAIVLEVHHRTPGNLRAFVQAIIRYINTGKSADVRFGSTDKVELVDIERKQLEFSYKDRNGYHFMLTARGDVKVLDFGLAKVSPLAAQADAAATNVTQPGTTPGVAMGTVAYMVVSGSDQSRL